MCCVEWLARLLTIFQSCWQVWSMLNTFSSFCIHHSPPISWMNWVVQSQITLQNVRYTSLNGSVLGCRIWRNRKHELRNGACKQQQIKFLWWSILLFEYWDLLATRAQFRYYDNWSSVYCMYELQNHPLKSKKLGSMSSGGYILLMMDSLIYFWWRFFPETQSQLWIVLLWNSTLQILLLWQHSSSTVNISLFSQLSSQLAVSNSETRHS